MATHSSILAWRIPRTGEPDWVTAHRVAMRQTWQSGYHFHNLKLTCFIERKNLDSMLKSRDITLPTKVHIVKAMIFPIVMYECESWNIKKAESEEWMLSNCGAREDPWEHLDTREIKPINPKGNQPWIFIARTHAKAEAPIHWPLDVKSQLIGKVLDAGRDWGQEEVGVTEDKMVGWHHRLNGHEFEQALGDGDGQGRLLQSTGSQRVRHNWVTEQKQ